MRLREFTSRLYHASKRAGIAVLEPKPSSLVDRDVVFAATHPEVAVAMAGHWSDDDFEFGRELSDEDDPDRIPYTMRELRRGAFEKFFSDSTYLYEVGQDGFKSNPEIQDFERISEKPQRVLVEKTIEDPLGYLNESKMVEVVRLN